MKIPKVSRTIRIPLIYGVFSIAWIVITDQLNYLAAPDVKYATLIAIIKGLVFVLASTFLIYVLLKVDERQEKSLRGELYLLQDSFAQMFANNPIPMWVNELGEFKFLAVNDSTCQLFGYSPDVFLNETLGVICAEEDRERVLKAAGKQFDGIYNTGPRKLIDHDGAIIHVDLVFVRFDYSGRPALLVTCLDLSKQQEIEESLRRTADERDAFESFSYSISHDLRANIRAVTGYSELLLEDCGDQLTGQAKAYLNNLKTAGAQMNQTIERMLMLSQLSHSKLSENWINLSALVESAAAEIQAREQANQPERTVQFKIQPDLSAMADADLMKAAIGNLIENAWKYTSPRALAVVEFGCLDIDAENQIFFVRDNGVGFDAQKALDLFKPFQRFHPVAEFPGSGMGLSIVAKIVQLHGGRIWAESEPDRGAAFYFTLRPEA